MLNAFALASAGVPAFLLARSVTGRHWAAFGAAAASIAVPWLAGPSLRLSEAVAYAVFVWAVLLLYRSTAAAGPLNDTLALAGIAAASLARLQFLVLLAVPPLAVLVHELGSAPGAGLRARVAAGVRSAVARHRLLALVYALLLLVGGALVVTGGDARLPGRHADILRGSLPPALLAAFVRHLAELSLSLAILPFLVAAGWLLATLGRRGDERRHAFASVAAVTVVLVVLGAASIDVRFGGGAVNERFLFYVVPVLAVAVACAVVSPRRLSGSLLVVVLTWLGLGQALSLVTTRVVDWFVMTDELLYERLAISIARTRSPLPYVRGELIESFNQLYPLVLSRVFGGGLVPDSLHDAHVLNAFVMTSAAVPVFLLARSVTGRAWPAYGVAVVSAAVPWLTLSSFLLTEVVAYPAFMWAVLGLYRSTAAPGPANDALALLGIGLATLARVQFLVLLLVLPLAVLLHELGSASGAGVRARLRAGALAAVSRHRLLAVAGVGVALAAAALAATGDVWRVLGTYALTARDPFPPGLARAFAEHLASVALSLAVLPFLVAAAWLLATLVRPVDGRRHAFAAVAGVTVALVTLQVASFDLRFGAGVVRERYLFYVVPVVLVALACALLAPRWPRWSLLGPAAVVGAGFATAGLPRFEKLNADTPLSVLHDRIVELGGSVGGARAGLVLLLVVLLLLFVQAVRLLPRPAVAASLAAMVAFAVPAETAYAFWRLFAVDGTSGRPLTLDQGGVFNWIDRHLGPEADVTMIPYPHLYGDYWATVAFWWDLEFWNKSVVRAAYLDGAFSGTPRTFAHVPLIWDRTGAVSVSPTRYVAQLGAESRFRIAGKIVAGERETYLIDAGSRWRLAWATSGLYDDGWTRPDTEATITVFPAPGQTTPATRFLSLSFRPAGSGEERVVRVASSLDEASAAVRDETVTLEVRVCVPVGEPGEVSLSVLGSGPILGNPVSAQEFAAPRSAGVHVAAIDLAAEGESGCSAGAGP